MPEIAQGTARGVVTHLHMKDSEIAGIKILPEPEGEAFWVNKGDYSPALPPGISKGTRIAVSYKEYGQKKFIEALSVLSEDVEPSKTAAPAASSLVTHPPVAAPSQHTVTVSVQQEPPKGPDPAALRLYARSMALDLAQRELQYNLPESYTIEDVIKVSKAYEEHLLASVKEAFMIAPEDGSPISGTDPRLPGPKDSIEAKLSQSMMHEFLEEGGL